MYSWSLSLIIRAGGAKEIKYSFKVASAACIEKIFHFIFWLYSVLILLISAKS